MQTPRPPQSDGPPPAEIGWRDSREAALALLDRRSRVLLRVLWIGVVGLAALVVWNSLTEALPLDQRAVLLLLVLAVGLWVTEAVPPFAVGLLIIGYLVFVFGTPLVVDEPRPVTPYVDTWSSEVVWLMLGGFVLADGMSRAGLDRELLTRAIRPAGTNPDRVLLAIMLTSAASSMFLSNTSTTVLLVGAVLPLVRQLGEDEPFGRGLLVAIPLSASVGGMGTIIGSPPNAIAVGVAAEFGRSVDFIEWMVLGVPISLVLVLLSWWLVKRLYPPTISSVSLEIEAGERSATAGRRDRTIVAAVALVTVALWMTTPLHGIHTAIISLLPIVALTTTQVVDAQRVRALPWDTLMLVAGGLSLGAAVVDTGLAERLASGLGFLTGFGTALPTLLLLALVTVVVSNFMSNTATVSLVLPIAVALLPGREVVTCLVLGLSASCALLLPVSTPPNAVAYATGEIRASHFRATGLWIGLLGPVVVVLWVSLLGVLFR